MSEFARALKGFVGSMGPGGGRFALAACGLLEARLVGLGSSLGGSGGWFCWWALLHGTEQLEQQSVLDHRCLLPSSHLLLCLLRHGHDGREV